jgi:hypothetical protein
VKSRALSSKKLYGARRKDGAFKDIQAYEHAHGQDIKRRAKAERNRWSAEDFYHL